MAALATALAAAVLAAIGAVLILQHVQDALTL